jgi:GT2 family glycosyltransferase
MNTTVVIVTRNRRDTLLHTLGRLGELPDLPPIVVVDNQSSDGTPQAVRRHHPAVGVIEAGSNLGGGARTIAARGARTPYLAFCDDDSWWAPGALERAAGLLDDNPQVALVAARIIVEPDGRLDPTCRLMEHSPLPAEPALPGPQILGFVACGAVVRRSAFLATGGFEPRFQVGGEETLLSIDLAAAGWRLVYAGDVVAHHQPSRSGRSSRSHREIRNALWTLWLRRPLGRALARSTGLLAGGGREGPAALGAALRELPWVVRERRVVPPEVERGLQAIER